MPETVTYDREMIEGFMPYDLFTLYRESRDLERQRFSMELYAGGESPRLAERLIASDRVSSPQPNLDLDAIPEDERAQLADAALRIQLASARQNLLSQQLIALANTTREKYRGATVRVTSAVLGQEPIVNRVADNFHDRPYRANLQGSIRGLQLGSNVLEISPAVRLLRHNIPKSIWADKYMETRVLSDTTGFPLVRIKFL